MSSPLQLLLTIAPLAGYLYLLGVWHAGRHPRVVGGSLDVTLLAVGLGGLVLFGPFGQLLAGMLFGQPDRFAWLFLSMAAVLVVRWLARRSRGRLVIYHVDAGILEPALGEALGPERFRRTLDGYEDRTNTRGVRVEYSPRWQTAVIKAFGTDPDALIHELRPRLAQRLRGVPAHASGVALVLFAGSALSMLVPLAGYVLSQAQTRAALRGLLQRLHGG